jgi:DNA-binding MarR family transcriptional regulator
MDCAASTVGSDAMKTRARRTGGPSSDAAAFVALFPAVYLRFHRRDGKRRALPAASRSVLQHLAVAGPLSIGEMGRHLDRAQSVVSEIVAHLERGGLLERVRDARDRRRALIWLTEAGAATLEREREVLSCELLSRAMANMSATDRRALLAGMKALIRADRSPRDRNQNSKQQGGEQ